MPAPATWPAAASSPAAAAFSPWPPSPAASAKPATPCWPRSDGYDFPEPSTAPTLPRRPSVPSPTVGVILGSKSDLPLMEACTAQLEAFGIEHEVTVCSAHRDPKGVMEWATGARERGLKVVIAAAGGAAHLPGVGAAWADLPVIGVPVPTEHLGGQDPLHSILPMPAGSPVPPPAPRAAGGTQPGLPAARSPGA